MGDVVSSWLAVRMLDAGKSKNDGPLDDEGEGGRERDGDGDGDGDGVSSLEGVGLSSLTHSVRAEEGDPR